MLAELRAQAEVQKRHARTALQKALVTRELRRQLHIGVPHARHPEGVITSSLTQFHHCVAG